MLIPIVSRNEEVFGREMFTTFYRTVDYVCHTAGPLHRLGTSTVSP